MVTARAVSLYGRLPYPLRMVVASARGSYLAWWRYSAATERMIEEILARETWSEAQWTAWQQEQTARVLDRAVRSVPWYRAHWAERRRRGDRASSEVLHNWPLLNKEELRRCPHAFLAEDARKRCMFVVHTSGTTGTPLTIWQSRATVQRQYALMETRWRGWNGVSRHDRWAIIGGQLVAPASQDEPPFWVWNAGLRQLYMSSIHISAKNAPYYADALRRHGVAYLWGYSSALHALATGLLAAGLPPPSLKVVITNAEPLLAHQRETIEAAFACPAVETYGMSEAVASASQCAHGRLHLWPESGIAEVLEDGAALEQGQTGDLVVTGLNNPDMPLIRYRTGDRVALGPRGERCDCGRSLPILAGVDGRSEDELVTRDGRRFGRLDPVFKGGLPVREAQIVQESLTRIRLRCVPTERWTASAEHDLKTRIRARLGDVAVTVELVDAIPRGANGKFRLTVSELSPEQKRAALAGSGPVLAET